MGYPSNDVGPSLRRENMQETGDKFRMIVEHIITPIFVIQKGRYVYVNAAFEKFTGYSAEDLYGMESCLDISDPEYKLLNLELHLQEKFWQEQYLNEEIKIKSRDGSAKWIVFNGAAIEYEGTPALLGSGIDNTGRKQSEEALRHSEEKYRLLHSQMTQGLAVHEVIADETSKVADYRFLDVNASFEKITGLKREHILGKTVLEVLPETEPYWIEKYGQVAMTGESLQYENFSRELGKHYRVAAYSPQIGQFAVIITDITEEKRMEEALRRSEEKYRSIFENISDGVYQISPEGRFISVNPAFAKIFGFRSAEEMMSSVVDVEQQLYVNPEDRTKLLQNLAEHNLHSFEAEMYRQDGSKTWLSFNVRAVRDHEGRLIYIEGMCRDISERKRSDELIKAAQQQMEQVIELLPDATAVIDRQGQVVFWNKAMEEMTGISKQQMIGRGNYEYSIPFYGERRPVLLDLALTADSQHGDINGKYDFVHQKGETLFGEIYVPESYHGRGAYLWGAASKLADPDGNIVGAIQSVRDISERKAAERARDEAAAIQRMTLLSIGDGVISTDNQGRIRLFNPIAEKLTGWTKEEAFGKSLEEVFDIRDEFTQEKCISPFRAVLEVGQTIENASHTILISKDGTKRPIEDIAAPINCDDGTMNGVVLVFRDIADKKERQEKIEYLSYHDHLTGLYNRRFFEEELKRLDTSGNLPISLIMADVNGLKLANDAFGHAVGDELLKTAAYIMKKECRSNDIIARTGGDEFIFVLPQTNCDDAEKMVKRLNESLAAEKVNSIILSVAFGWATKSEVSEDISTIYKKAEDYMYRRKLSQSSSMESRTIKVIMSTLYEKSHREEQHSQRVSELCEAIGQAMDIGTEVLGDLRTGGLLHDIGKITLDERILDKPGKLNASEWFEIKRHSETGCRILSSVTEFLQLADYVLAHHERWDGKGYPNGLKGTEIPMQARIMALADAYDAMTSDRPYRRALSEDMVVNEIKRNAGVQFDPVIAKVFVEKVLGMSWE